MPRTDDDEDPDTVTGIVFHDRNQDGVHQPRLERGITRERSHDGPAPALP